jgi:hypothetical protein
LFALSAACANGEDNMWGIAPKAKIMPICAVNLSLGKETDIGDYHFSQSPICNTVVS